MNEQAIVDKLSIFLSEHPIFREECAVIYFLVEIRKLIEDDQKNFRTLYFYCCWVAHSRLSHPNIADFLSDKFDSYIDPQKKKSEIQKDLIKGQKDFFKLRDLNEELKDFLSNKEVPIDFLSGNKWYRFCQRFLDNIGECQIDISKLKNKNHPHKVNKLTVEKKGLKYYYVFSLEKDVRIPGIALEYKSK